MTPIINSALLGLIEQTGTAVVTLIEGLEQSELLRSRLTRGEVLRQLKTLADSAEGSPGARAHARAVSHGALSLPWPFPTIEVVNTLNSHDTHHLSRQEMHALFKNKAVIQLGDSLAPDLTFAPKQSSTAMWR